MKRILFIVVLAALLVATTGAASAGTTRTYFTGSESCGTPIFPREWVAGTNWQVRDISSVCKDKADSPKYTGISYLSEGKLMWLDGMANPLLTTKLRMETKEGGVWVGNAVLPAYTDEIKIVMQGQGLYEGMQIHVFLSYSNNTLWGYYDEVGN